MAQGRVRGREGEGEGEGEYLLIDWQIDICCECNCNVWHTLRRLFWKLSTSSRRVALNRACSDLQRLATTCSDPQSTCGCGTHAHHHHQTWNTQIDIDISFKHGSIHLMPLLICRRLRSTRNDNLLHSTGSKVRLCWQQSEVRLGKVRLGWAKWG